MYRPPEQAAAAMAGRGQSTLPHNATAHAAASNVRTMFCLHDFEERNDYRIAGLANHIASTPVPPSVGDGQKDNGFLILFS
jgi:hypothetical protein